MAETVDKDLAEVRKLMKGNKMIVGSERTLKNLKLGKIGRVYISSNCAEKTKGAIEHYSRLGKASVISLRYPNDELGILCKKQFSISVLSVLK